MRDAASITQVTLASPQATVAPAAPAAAGTPAGYVVRPGDTLSGIAAALGVPGGWPALYAANRRVIGPDPGLIQPGMVLALPGPRLTRYTVAAGDTLAGIAAALGVPGGWPALYAANRRVIGRDPDLIRPGTVLAIIWPPAATRPAAATRPPAPIRPPAPAQAPASPTRPPRPVSPPAPARHHAAPPRTVTRAPAGMPQWLRTMLIAVGLLVGAAFLAELVPAIARRRRDVTGRTRPESAPAVPEAVSPEAVSPEAVSPEAVSPEAAGPAPPPAASSRPPFSGRFVVADYDRLVVTHCRTDNTVYVLRPPGADPRAILRVARLVLAEDPYQELAGQLGVPASWPME